MNSNDSPIYIVGYGTFIPNKTYLKSTDVKVCIVRNYRRIWMGDTIFPFILKDPQNFGFYALVFSLSPSHVAKLDVYEGVETGLFTREKISVELLDGTAQEAYIYVPTIQTIKERNLKIEDDLEDCWLEEIQKNKEIVKLFPQLVQKWKINSIF